MGEILYKDESFAIQGAIFEVYREMGCGFLEAVYQECLAKEFSRRNVPFALLGDGCGMTQSKSSRLAANRFQLNQDSEERQEIAG